MSVVRPEYAILPRLEHSARARRWAFWLGLATVWLFVASFLQFGRLQSAAAPASERVNDGSRATFFAVHINPYYTASEDFHLYAVRAKRILDRGWTDSLLWRNENARPSYASPLQVGIMMLAVATDGRPEPYALFVCGILLVSWTILYVAAAWWLPRTASPITPMIAVLVAVLFESTGFLNHPGSEFSQWPPHRGLRMATFAWSTPLLMAAVIAGVSLIFRRERPWGRIAFIAGALAGLALGDSWAFILAAGCLAVVGALLAGLLLSSAWRPIARRPLVINGASLALLVLGTLLLQQATTGFAGDALARAGFGDAWRHSPVGVHENAAFRSQMRKDLTGLTILAIASSVYVSIRLAPARGGLRCRLYWRRPTNTRLHLWCLVAVPVVAVMLIIGAFSRYGMEGYHALQFMWRRDFFILFAVIVFTIEIVKRLFRSVAIDRRRSIYLEVAGAVALMAGLLAYHNLRIHKFISRNAAYEYFLTEDAQQLGDWLRERDRTAGEYTLATASHELNYLCAYWTDADLLLPEGFPYHDATSADEIERRTARLLAVYGATPQSWTEFNLHRHPTDQWIWSLSRLTSARCGNLYYLLHRELLIDGQVAKSIQPTSRGVTRRIADSRVTADDNLQGWMYERNRRGEEFVLSVAMRLDGGLTPQERPNVIIIDEVSRAIGTPNLDGYVREFQHGDIEAWVLTN